MVTIAKRIVDGLPILSKLIIQAEMYEYENLQEKHEYQETELYIGIILRGLV
jgi:hypothetical protein